MSYSDFEIREMEREDARREMQEIYEHRDEIPAEKEVKNDDK